MADHVSQHRAVAVDAGNADRVVEDIRHAHAELVVVGDRLAQFIEGGRVGHQQLAVLPQCAQVEIELAFDVGEQRAVAFALQHRATIGGFEAEVFGLPLRMAGVIANAVVGPVSQAGRGQQIQQTRRLIEKMRQAGAGKGGVMAVDGTRGAPHQIQRDVDVELDLLGRMQAPRDRGQGLQEGRDGLAVGRFLHGADGAHHLRQQGFLIAACRGSHCRPLLKESQQRLGAAAKLADEAGRLDIGIELRLVEAGERGVDALFKDIGNGRKAAVECQPRGLHLRMRISVTARHLSDVRDHRPIAP